MNEFLLSVEHFQQQCRWGLNELNERLYQYRQGIAQIILILLLVIFVAFLMGSPIKMTDTDLWYHLAGGRYTWQNWTVNDSAFFSFITPEKEWINYFWGFQVLIFKLHELFGYTGLLVFKTLIYMSIVSIFILMLKHGNEEKYLGIVQLGLLILFIYVLSGRTIQVRPHMISYLFTITFIYILFFNNKRIWLLPVLTIFWANLHGIEWVIGALIGGAYTLQQLVSYQSSRDRAVLKPVLWVLLCLPALMLNPYGVEILTTPFNVTEDAYLFISELRPVSIAFNSMFYANNAISPAGSFILLLLIVITGLFILWNKGKLTISTLILTLGGGILLIKGTRFIWEWMLLSSLLLVQFSQYLKHRNIVNIPGYLQLTLLFYFLVSMLFMAYKDTGIERYPLDDSELPVATTSFIQKMGIKGRYFVDATYAGYIEWKLYPDVSIFIDMEFPPFDGYDYLNYLLGQYNEKGANQIINQYQPDLIGVDRSNRLFLSFSHKLTDYVPVVLDKALVLFINKVKYPDIAEKYQIKYLNLMSDVLGYNGENLDEKIQELERLLSFQPDNPYVISVLCMALVDNHKLEQAAPWLKKLEEDYPDLPISYYINGVASYYAGDFSRSIMFLNKALDLASLSGTNKVALYKQLGMSYYLLKDFEQAYVYFEKGINIYKLSEKLETYYQYAYAAFVSDDVERADKICKLILLRADANQKVYKDAQNLLNVIEKGEYSRSFWKA